MVVIGVQGTTIQHTGKCSDVNEFAAHFGMMTRVPIVDAIIAYNCPHSGEIFLLVARNDLYIKSMDHNLVPPFIMRESGLEANEQAKIHPLDPTKHHHSMWDTKSELPIPLQLCETFSVFNTRQLTQEEINEAGEYKVIFISPGADYWNPNCEDWDAM